MLITSIIMVQKNFHRDLGTKWVGEQFSLQKFFQTGLTRGPIFLVLEPENLVFVFFLLLCMSCHDLIPKY